MQKANHVSVIMKNIVFSIILFVLVALFIFAIAEVAIRLSPKRHSHGYIRSRNKKLVYELYPNYHIKRQNTCINSQGMNDRIFQTEKKADTYRIAVVGDSTSFGLFVGSEHSFPKKLEKKLENYGKREYEVINFSVPGYNTAQELELIKSKVLDYKPDLILLYFCGNDTHLTNLFQPKVTIRNFLYNRSYFFRYMIKGIDRQIYHIPGKNVLKGLWVFMKKNLLGMYYFNMPIYISPGLEQAPLMTSGNPPNRKNNVPEQYWYMLGLNNYKIHLSKIRDVLQENNIPMILCGYFHKDLVWNYLNESEIEHILNLGKELEAKGLKYSDLLLPNDGHFDIEGHGFVADSLYDYLIKNQFIEQSIAKPSDCNTLYKLDMK